MKKYLIPLIPSVGLLLIYLGLPDPVAFKQQSPVSLQQLNSTITKAQKYYEGLYVDLGKDGAVVAEYYPKIKYTVRHATIGGIYYYEYIGDKKKSSKLRQFALKNGFSPIQDEHSFIWTKTSMAPKGIVYSSKTYHDCFVTLPTFDKITPYRSKVCSLGSFGVQLYIASTRLDTFVPMIDMLERIEQGEKTPDTKHLQERYNRLGFGIPVCTPLNCSSTSSTIRTAQFGELQLRTGNKKYADSVATALVKAQDKNGAIYISYDSAGNRKEDKSILYHILDKLFNDKSAYKGSIATNAETMNDSLAFLMHYRCEKYGVKCGGTK
jgi:hypothetical protein